MVIISTQYLGKVRGKSDGVVAQYLGIQYATILNRFAEATLNQTRDGGVLDATKNGPTSISPLSGCELEFSVMQQSLPRVEHPQSDLSCLNLNITAPAGSQPSSRLPVFVFIHGGGLQIGANSWPQFDLARFVKLSIDKELPVLAVSVNYRLGPFGFLTSEELRDAGFKANNGLRDQQVALEWLRRHIKNFGGDPNNVTLMGMSAGAACVQYHLDCDKALFQRAILMSGNYVLIKPLTHSQHEENYKHALTALGLENASAGERIKFLLEKSAQDIISALFPSTLAAPAVDGLIVQAMPGFAQPRKQALDVSNETNWCRELMIGDAQMDANIFEVMIPDVKTNCLEKFRAAMNSVFLERPELTQQIMHQYGIFDGITDEVAFPSILDYLNDVAFLAPTLDYAQGWTGNAFVYYFNEGNPWAGPSKGRAGHLLDLVYLFQNFTEHLTPLQQECGTIFAEDCFKFCHGIRPWSAIKPKNLSDGFCARVYSTTSSPKTRVVYQPFGGPSERRSILFDHLPQVSLDEHAKVFDIFRGLHSP